MDRISRYAQFITEEQYNNPIYNNNQAKPEQLSRDDKDMVSAIKQRVDINPKNAVQPSLIKLANKGRVIDTSPYEEGWDGAGYDEGNDADTLISQAISGGPNSQPSLRDQILGSDIESGIWDNQKREHVENNRDMGSMIRDYYDDFGDDPSAINRFLKGNGVSKFGNLPQGALNDLFDSQGLSDNFYDSDDSGYIHLVMQDMLPEMDEFVKMLSDLNLTEGDADRAGEIFKKLSPYLQKGRPLSEFIS